MNHALLESCILIAHNTTNYIHVPPIYFAKIHISLIIHVLNMNIEVMHYYKKKFMHLNHKQQINLHVEIGNISCKEYIHLSFFVY